MNVTCKNPDYMVKELGDRVMVRNSTYDAKYKLILILSILEFFSPDSEMYKVPVTIIIPKNERNEAANIVIDRKLRIHGTDDYEIAILKCEYGKWQKSYLIMNILTIIVALMLLIFALALVISSDMNAIVAAVVLAFFVYLPAALIVRLFKQLKMVSNIKKIQKLS